MIIFSALTIPAHLPGLKKAYNHQATVRKVRTLSDAWFYFYIIEYDLPPNCIKWNSISDLLMKIHMNYFRFLHNY